MAQVTTHALRVLHPELPQLLLQRPDGAVVEEQQPGRGNAAQGQQGELQDHHVDAHKGNQELEEHHEGHAEADDQGAGRKVGGLDQEVLQAILVAF